MRERPKQSSTIIASGRSTGGDVLNGKDRSGRKRREEATIRVEVDFDGRFPVGPREIELMNHYLGQMIDALLRGED